MAKTYGTVSLAQQKAMSGLEFVKGLACGLLPLNTIAQTLGYDVVEAEDGRVVITLEPTGAHLNPWGTVHGRPDSDPSRQLDGRGHPIDTRQRHRQYNT
jgi:hypothetical protein